MNSTSSPVPAPGGWGFRPGADMRPMTRERIRLPALPLLRFVGPGRVTPVLVRALAEIPDALPLLTASMLTAAYPIPRSMAYDVLRKAGPTNMLEPSR